MRILNAKEKEAFEAELKKLLDKLPPEAQEVVKRYFNAEKPQMPNDERLKELAKELEKLFEIVEQKKTEQKNPEQNVPGVRTPGNESPKNGINNGLHGISASSGNAQTPGNKNSKQQ